MKHRLPLLPFVVLAVLLFPAPTWSFDADIAAVTGVRGPVTFRRPGSGAVAVAVKGAALRIGDEVRTGEGGLCQVTLADETFIDLGPRSAVRINQFSLNEATDRRTGVIQVISGSARIVVYRLRSKDSMLRVEAEPASVYPDSLADIAVTVSPSGAEATVLRGGARVRNRLAYIVGEVRLRENQGTKVLQKTPPASASVVTLQARQDILRRWKGL